MVLKVVRDWYSVIKIEQSMIKSIRFEMYLTKNDKMD